MEDQKKKGNVVFAADGAGTDKMLRSTAYVALVSDEWIQTESLLSQAEEAEEAGKPMYAVVLPGTTMLAKIEKRFGWKAVYVCKDVEEMSKAVLKILRSEGTT